MANPTYKLEVHDFMGDEEVDDDTFTYPSLGDALRMVASYLPASDQPQPDITLDVSDYLDDTEDVPDAAVVLELVTTNDDGDSKAFRLYVRSA